MIDSTWIYVNQDRRCCMASLGHNGFIWRLKTVNANRHHYMFMTAYTALEIINPNLLMKRLSSTLQIFMQNFWMTTRQGCSHLLIFGFFSTFFIIAHIPWCLWWWKELSPQGIISTAYKASRATLDCILIMKLNRTNAAIQAPFSISVLEVS